MGHVKFSDIRLHDFWVLQLIFFPIWSCQRVKLPRSEWTLGLIADGLRVVLQRSPCSRNYLKGDILCKIHFFCIWAHTLRYPQCLPTLKLWNTTAHSVFCCLARSETMGSNELFRFGPACDVENGNIRITPALLWVSPPPALKLPQRRSAMFYSRKRQDYC